MPLVVLMRPRAGHRLALDLAVGGAGNFPDLPVAPLPVRVARIDRAVLRDGHVVGLVEGVGTKVFARNGAAGLDDEDVVLLVVGDEHPAVGSETGRDADAACRQRGEELGGRRVRPQPADRSGLLEVDDVEISGGVDGRALDPERVFAGPRHLPALKQRRIRIRRSADQQSGTQPKEARHCFVQGNTRCRPCTRH